MKRRHRVRNVLLYLVALGVTWVVTALLDQHYSILPDGIPGGSIPPRRPQYEESRDFANGVTIVPAVAIPTIAYGWKFVRWLGIRHRRQ